MPFCVAMASGVRSMCLYVPDDGGGDGNSGIPGACA